MPQLLCRQKAKLPYYYEKLNLRLWSAQELCYLIMRYPLLALEDFPTEDLLLFLKRELHMEQLAARLSREQAAGESRENLLLLILQECNYFDLTEIGAFRQRLMTLRSLSREDYLRETASALLAAGRLQRARSALSEAVEATDQRIRKTADGAEKGRLLQKKAALYLDMASVSAQMFDEKRAQSEIAAAELYAKSKRGLSMGYLLTGESKISEEDQKLLSEKRERLTEEQKKSAGFEALTEMFSHDPVRLRKEAGEQILKWKKEYRRML